MDELRELYQEVILDHGRHPRNCRFPPSANRSGEGHNPLCGDRITVKAVIENGRIIDIGFQGSGCAISQAAASTMTEAVKGLSVEQAQNMFAKFHALVTGNAKEDFGELDRLSAFAGVAEFPMRVKCATLAWHTLDAALKGQDAAVSTES